MLDRLDFGLNHPSIRFSAARTRETEGPVKLSMREGVSPAMQQAAQTFAEYVEALGYTATGLFNNTSKPDKDFVLYEESIMGTPRLTVWFHHESLTPKIRQADYKEALAAVAALEGIQKTGENTFKLGGVPLIVMMETPSRPLNHWGNDGLSKRAKRLERERQTHAQKARKLSSGKTLAPVPLQRADAAALQAELVPAVGKILDVALRRAGLTVGRYGKDQPTDFQVLLEERDGLHGRQLMLRNQNPKLDGPARNALHHKIMTVLSQVDGMERLGTVSFRLHDIFLSVWSPPVKPER